MPQTAGSAGMALLIDDRASGSLTSSLGTVWRNVTDSVMGGVSAATLAPEVAQGKAFLHLRGAVSLENNGGFVQASLDLAANGFLDAGAYQGIEIEVCGNGESYNLHLRTADTAIVWQSYRAGFIAGARWQTIRLPFAEFQPHRIDLPLDTRRLRRLGVVAIGRVMQADIRFARLALYG